ncbi:hypothetical protein GOP47_0014105 [Adiantum capillus-veneris]|uniref:Uncharacterized protein n=1 Tax=Adiantum capillus-veneris TaxID=13818 RepID=A0A9D4UPT1_ADICA|nr:hypothetical protein GOP47_0014105 [Adiantum capillus-veneris]
MLFAYVAYCKASMADYSYSDVFPRFSLLLLFFILQGPLSLADGHVPPIARHLSDAHPMRGRHIIFANRFRSIITRHLTSLVPSPAPMLTYHNGTLLTGNSQSELLVHLLWYGAFTSSQRSIVVDFFKSFSQPIGTGRVAPSVWSWWQTARSYVDKRNARVAAKVTVGAQISDKKYSSGKTLQRIHMETLLRNAIVTQSLPSIPTPKDNANATNTLYLILTSADVFVEHFCMDSCGFHDYTPLATNGKSKSQMPFVWVGNAGRQCPGLCAWPFAIPAFGPPNPALLPPNHDVGMDGMIINIAMLLAGVATNPFGTGYFQGDALAPLEAATACTGSFGTGSYPGYPGMLLVDNTTKASFNAWGINQRMYLLPALWSPHSLTCVTPV